MNIHIPFAKDKNLGREVNKLINNSTDRYVIIQDGDVMQLNAYYGNRISEAVEANPQFQLFTCYTNRIGRPEQVSPHADWANDDIKHHRELANEHWNMYGTSVIDVTDAPLLSGHLFVIDKEYWKYLPDLPNIGLGCDNEIHKMYKEAGYKVGLMQGIYVYHWYRGGDKQNKDHWK